MAGLPEVARNMAVCLHLFAPTMAVWRPFEPFEVVSSPLEAFGPFRDRWRRLGRSSPLEAFQPGGGVWVV